MVFINSFSDGRYSSNLLSIYKYKFNGDKYRRQKKNQPSYLPKQSIQQRLHFFQVKNNNASVTFYINKLFISKIAEGSYKRFFGCAGNGGEASATYRHGIGDF